MGGTKNHEHVGRHLTYSLVGPGEAWPPTTWIDVWGKNALDHLVDRERGSSPRPCRISEISGELVAKRMGSASRRCPHGRHGAPGRREMQPITAACAPRSVHCPGVETHPAWL